MHPQNSSHGGFLRLILWATAAIGAVVLTRSAEDPAVDPIHPSTRYEHRDVNAKAVVWTGLAAFALMWIAIFLVFPFFLYLNHTTNSEPGTLRQGLILPPEPRLQSNPKLDLQEFRAQEQGDLNSYHWVDPSKGVVSIPIDRAIQIIAQRGIPAQPAPNDITYFDPQAGTRQTGFEGKVAPEPR